MEENERGENKMREKRAETGKEKKKKKAADSQLFVGNCRARPHALG